jgi:DNA-binding NtrC family response regulator
LRLLDGTSAELIKIVETTLKQRIKFIVMSGQGNPTIEKNDIDFLLYSFLNKPLDISSLIKKVTSVKDGKQ